MSKKEDFHPSLSTLDVAKFQLLENGFAGVTNGVTMIPAKDTRTIDAHHLLAMINKFIESSEDIGDAQTLILTTKAFLEQYPENPSSAVLVVFRPAIKDGEANVQPIARIIDPWEVIEPEFAHTDGAGNVREPNGGVDHNPTNPSRNKGNGSAA